MTDMQKTMVLCSGSVNRALAEGIAKELGVSLADMEHAKFANGEIYARFEESVAKPQEFVHGGTAHLYGGEHGCDLDVGVLFTCDVEHQLVGLFAREGFARDELSEDLFHCCACLLMVNVLIVEEPVSENGGAVGSKDTLGVELDAAYVESTVAKSHYLSFGTLGSDFDTVGKTLAGDDPRVVAAYRKLSGEASEEWVFCTETDRGLDAVKDVGEIFEMGTEGFSDGLMAEADTKYGFTACVGADDIEE